MVAGRSGMNSSSGWRGIGAVEGRSGRLMGDFSLDVRTLWPASVAGVWSSGRAGYEEAEPSQPRRGLAAWGRGLDRGRVASPGIEMPGLQDETSPRFWWQQREYGFATCTTRYYRQGDRAAGGFPALFPTAVSPGGPEVLAGAIECSAVTMLDRRCRRRWRLRRVRSSRWRFRVPGRWQGRFAGCARAAPAARPSRRKWRPPGRCCAMPERRHG